VAEYGNYRIQILNSNGQFVRKFGSKGNKNGQMNAPIGVGLLSNGNIVVVEHGGNRLQIFDSQGNLFGLWVQGSLANHIISLLILMTTSWWLIRATIASRYSTRMATTSSQLELGSSQFQPVFAWIVREGSLWRNLVPKSPSFSGFVAVDPFWS